MCSTCGTDLVLSGLIQITWLKSQFSTWTLLSHVTNVKLVQDQDEFNPCSHQTPLLEERFMDLFCTAAQVNHSSLNRPTAGLLYPQEAADAQTSNQKQ